MANIGIMDLFRTAHRGQFLNELEGDLQSCVEAVQESGKGGKLCIEIKIDPTDKDALQVMAYCQASVKLPRAVRGGNLYFLTDGGGMSQRDPRQPDMPGEMSVVRAEGIDGKSAAAGARAGQASPA